MKLFQVVVIAGWFAGLARAATLEADGQVLEWKSE